MDRVFSVEAISDHYWSPPRPPPPTAKLGDSTAMNRSESEWAFQLLLQEVSSAEAALPTTPDSSPQSSSAGNDVVEIKERNPCVTSNGMSGGGSAAFSAGGAAAAPNIPVDSEEYQAFLKSKLSLACAAVALSRASFLKPEDSLAGADSGSQSSNTSQLRSHAPSKGAGHDLSRLQDKDVNESLGISSLPAAQKIPGGSVKPATSWSSRDQSEDDENEGETEITEDMDAADAKRARRMLSNRESARRSRRRKQAHLSELETQVAALRVENSTLLKRLGGISQKYSEAAVNNRVLKADVETLRAKVKMAEETVKRITGLNHMFRAMPEISAMSMPSFDGSPSETSADVAVAVQDDPKHHFYRPPNSPISTNDKRASNSLAEISSAENVQRDCGAAGLAGSKMGRTASIQRVASLEHLQKRIRGGASSPGPQSNGTQE